MTETSCMCATSYRKLMNALSVFQESLKPQAKFQDILQSTFSFFRIVECVFWATGNELGPSKKIK